MSKLKPIDLTAPAKPRFSIGGNVAQSSVRKISVKNLKPTPPSVPQKYYQNTYDKLLQTTRAVLREQVIAESLESLYRGSENLVRNGQGQMLYDAVHKEIKDYVNDEMKMTLEEVVLKKQRETAGDKDSQNVMEILVNAWDKWMSKVRLLCSIFYFLERAYILIEGRQSISDVGSEEFSRGVLQNDIEKRFSTAIYTALGGERSVTANSNSIDSTYTANAIRVYLSLPIDAKSRFLQRLSESSLHDYHRLSENYRALAPAQFIRQYQQFMKEEQIRLEHYLSAEPVQIEQLMINAENNIGLANLQWLISTGLSDLINMEEMKCLQIILELDQHMENRNAKLLEKALNHYIEVNGLKIVSNPENDSTMIPSLLAFKKRMDGLLASAFNFNDNLAFTLREAFGKFINTRQNKPAEMIAKYLDACLRRGTLADGSNLDDNALESELDKVLELFRFVEGKDVFEAFYKKDLAKRLLLNKSASADAERSMLTKLKTGNGSLLLYLD